MRKVKIKIIQKISREALMDIGIEFEGMEDHIPEIGKKYTVYHLNWEDQNTPSNIPRYTASRITAIMPGHIQNERYIYKIEYL